MSYFNTITLLPQVTEIFYLTIEEITEDPRRPLGHGFVAAKVLLEKLELDLKLNII